MGIEMVESTDLFVEGKYLYMKTGITFSNKSRCCLQKNLDDIKNLTTELKIFNPLCFNPQSLNLIPGIMDVYRTGGVNICSAPDQD